MEQNGYYQSGSTDEEQPHPETQQMDITFRIVPGPMRRLATSL